MARPKTRSDTIQVRLPLEFFPDVEKLAAKHGITVAAAVERLCVARLKHLRAAKKPKCDHAKAKMGSSGFLVCPCGASKPRGEWVEA